MFLDKKHFTIIERKFKYGKVLCKVKNKFTVECLGGEKMNNEENQLVFIDTDSIPKALKGKTGRNWKELCKTIPEGKSAVIPESYGTGATVRQAIKNINEELGTIAYKVTQRTENKNTIVYVIRM